MAVEADNTITQVRVDIGELKGILNTVVISHAGLIKDLQSGQDKLRVDLTAVKDNANDAIQKVAQVANTNTANIITLTSDVKDVENKQNSSGTRVLAVIAGIVGAAGLLWNVIGGK